MSPPSHCVSMAENGKTDPRYFALPRLILVRGRTILARGLAGLPKLGFPTWCKMMVENDLELAEQEENTYQGWACLSAQARRNDKFTCKHSQYCLSGHLAVDRHIQTETRGGLSPHLIGFVLVSGVWTLTTRRRWMGFFRTERPGVCVVSRKQRR